MKKKKIYIIELPPKCSSCGAYLIQDLVTGEYYCKYCSQKSSKKQVINNVEIQD